MAKKTKKEMAKRAAEIASAKLKEKIAHREDADALDSWEVLAEERHATLVKTFYDSKIQKVIYSKPLVDHTTRVKASSETLRLQELRQEDKVNVDLRILTDYHVDFLLRFGGKSRDTLPSEEEDE